MSGYTQHLEYSFAPKAEPSFVRHFISSLRIFLTFIYDTRSLYDPLMPESVDNGVDMSCQNMHAASDTSFPQDWNPPSHMTPADVEDTFAMDGYNLKMFENPGSFGRRPLDMDSGAFLSADFEALSTEPAFRALDYSTPQLGVPDSELSAFMSAIHQHKY
jgi:hypothetical protein